MANVMAIFMGKPAARPIYMPIAATPLSLRHRQAIGCREYAGHQPCTGMPSCMNSAMIRCATKFSILMHHNHEENIESVKKTALQFLAEAIGQNAAKCCLHLLCKFRIAGACRMRFR
ncbi:MAG: hypothetical protein JZU65_20330 [Chlorobium sp.]|jgi:hypothetical protein|nr:hypothetical protein [Chlorobium sp.]